MILGRAIPDEVIEKERPAAIAVPLARLGRLEEADQLAASGPYAERPPLRRSYRTSLCCRSGRRGPSVTGLRRASMEDPLIRRSDTRQGKTMSAARYHRRHRPCRVRWNRACM